MKKLIFLVLGLTFSFFCHGQNTVSFSDAAKVDLPNGRQKIQREDAVAFAGKRFNNEPLIMRSIGKRNKLDSIYLINNVLVTLNAQNKSSEKGHLAQLKMGLDEMSRRDPSHSSKLETINNNDVLIEDYIVGGVGNYRFYLFNASYTRSLTGILEFDKNDKAEATAILNHILQSVSLKE